MTQKQLNDTRKSSTAVIESDCVMTEMTVCKEKTKNENVLAIEGRNTGVMQQKKHLVPCIFSQTLIIKFLPPYTRFVTLILSYSTSFTKLSERLGSLCLKALHHHGAYETCTTSSLAFTDDLFKISRK